MNEDTTDTSFTLNDESDGFEDYFGINFDDKHWDYDEEEDV